MGLKLLHRKKSFKILLISGILIILGVFVISGYSQVLEWWKINFEGVEAGTSDNVRGWAWGENMGWISMNCYNDFDYDYLFENCCLGGTDCPTGLEGDSYGVTYNTSADILTGYAWSDKVGWICFGETCGATATPHGWPFAWACVGRPTWTCSNDSGQTCINDDGCPSGTCVFSCSGDGEEDFLDISAPGAPCYSATRETLKAHWTMNTINVFDGSSNTNNGTLVPADNPPVLANGKFENALEFDGENDYIDITDSLSLSVTGNLVIEGWIKRGAIGSEQTIIGKWDETEITGHQKSYRLWFDINNKLNFSVADTNDNEATITQTQGLCFGGAEGDASTPCSADTGCYDPLVSGTFCRNPLITDTTKWHHIAGKYIATIGTNAASLQLFIDGARVNVGFIGIPPDSLFKKNNDLYIGAKKNNLGNMDTHFNGIIDNVAIWSCGGSTGFIPGRSAKDIWADAKIEISGWAKVVALGDGGWLKLQGSTNAGKIWGLYLDDYDTFYTVGGYMANRYADTSMDTEGLIANWLMDEPSWTNSVGPIPNGVVDSGPLVDKNHGTASGATPSTDGKFNSAGEFDGVDDYIEVSDDATLDFTAIPIENFTIQYWAKPNSFPTNGSMPIVKRQSGAGYEIQIDEDGSISWFISDGTYNKADTDNASPLTVNTWNHVTIVFDRSNNQIIRYLNGVVAGTVDDFGDVGDLSNDLSLFIGGRFLREDAYFHGLIDNMSIYSIAKTSTQILADYNKQDPYCVGWDDYDHDYGDPPAPFDFEITEIDNTDGGCYQLLVYWDQSTWAESYTYWRCDNVEESVCDTCSYTERNILSGACDEYGKCSLQGDGLGENTGYCYKIQSHNEIGSTYNSNGPKWERTTLCDPEVPTINDDTCGEIKLTWSWDSEGSVDGYNIYNSLGSSENFGIIGHLGEAMDYTGLMAQWKMNETSWDGSNDEVRDSSNQTPANHGTASGAIPSTDGKFNSAGEFDGVNDYINCGSNDSLEASTATIQAWIKRTSTDTRDVVFADNKISEADEYHFLRWEIGADDRLAVIFGDETDSVVKYSTGLINDINWHHIVFVRDDSAKIITFYIDGEAEDEQSYFNELNTICSGGDNPGALCDSDVDCIGGGTCVGVIIPLGEDNLWIGRSNENDTGPFRGLIDNLAIYNSAKTAEQIKLDYEASSLSTVCHVEGVADDNCDKIQADPSACCYTDKRILSYIDYYYRTTATSDAGESPFSNCNWGEVEQPDCPSGVSGSCCPWGNTICFPPVETEEK